MGNRRRPDRCPEPEDLTAFAHGEAEPASRARVSAHLLACSRCRSRHDEARGLLRRLGDLGGDWRALAAAGRAPSTTGRSAWASAFAGAGMAAVFLVAFLFPREPAGGPRGPGARSLPSAAEAAAVSALLAEQRRDGSFPATGAFRGARADEATTALTLLALLPEPEEGPPRQGERARAVGEAARWLVARRRAAPSRPATGSEARAEAVGAAALAAALRRTSDPALRPEVEAGVHRLLGAGDDLAADPVALRWAHHALREARAAGIPLPEEPVRRLAARLGPEAARAPWEPTPRWRPVGDGADAAAPAVALRVLRGRAVP